MDGPGRATDGPGRATDGSGRTTDGSGGATDDALVRARTLLLSGDTDGLRRLLSRQPDLIGGRFTTEAAPYDGYFHGATLLHHVAGNPLQSRLPPNLPEVTALLLDRGADVDAVTLPGPSQPDDIGWTTLGLVATSSEARKADLQERLMDLLLDAGADVDARGGGCLMGALYYGETRAAEHLAQRAARLDLVASAGVGDTDALRRLLDEGARPGDDTHEGDGAGPRLAHYSRVPWPADATYADLLGMALVYAALHGRIDAIHLLLDAGADPDHRPPFDHRGTALHWAVMGDRPDSVQALLEAGASPEVRDLEHDATPAQWARHLGREAAEAALDGA